MLSFPCPLERPVPHVQPLKVVVHVPARAALRVEERRERFVELEEGDGCRRVQSQRRRRIRRRRRKTKAEGVIASIAAARGHLSPAHHGVHRADRVNGMMQLARTGHYRATAGPHECSSGTGAPQSPESDTNVSKQNCGGKENAHPTSYPSFSNCRCHRLYVCARS